MNDLLQEKTLTCWKVAADVTAATVAALSFSSAAVPNHHCSFSTRPVESHSERSHRPRYEEIVRELRRDGKEQMIEQVFQIPVTVDYQSYESICAARHGGILLRQKSCGISGGKNAEVNPYERRETRVYRLFDELFCL